MPRRRQKAGRQIVRNADRRRQALELRIAGLTFDAIGKRLGITKQAAHELVMNVLAETRAITAKHAEDLRVLELERLDAIIAALWSKRRGHNTANALVRAIGKRASMQGLEAPKLIGLGGIDGGPVQVQPVTIKLVRPGEVPTDGGDDTQGS